MSISTLNYSTVAQTNEIHRYSQGQHGHGHGAAPVLVPSLSGLQLAPHAVATARCGAAQGFSWGLRLVMCMENCSMGKSPFSMGKSTGKHTKNYGKIGENDVNIY